MSKDSVLFGVAGIFFGLLVGWIIGTQQAGRSTTAVPTAVAAPAPGATSASATPAQPPPFDAARATTLERQAAAEPANADVRLELGNIYFDGERYTQAIPWYQAALKLDPQNVNASTDLAVAYYYSDQADQALAQLERSLQIDPKHLKTLLNQGIVRAFGKRDLAGAAESWQKVVSIAPDSEEGRRAKQGLDGLNSAHQGAAGSAGGGQ